MRVSARAISRPCSNRSSSTRSAAACSRRQRSMTEPGGLAARGALAPIAYVYSQPEASVLIATLRAYGFAAMSLDQDTIYVAPWLMLALGGIGVVVPADQEEDALALLEAIDG